MIRIYRTIRRRGSIARSPTAWWTLADAAGNEADVATTMSRD